MYSCMDGYPANSVSFCIALSIMDGYYTFSVYVRSYIYAISKDLNVFTTFSHTAELLNIQQAQHQVSLSTDST